MLPKTLLCKDCDLSPIIMQWTKICQERRSKFQKGSLSKNWGGPMTNELPIWPSCVYSKSGSNEHNAMLLHLLSLFSSVASVYFEWITHKHTETMMYKCCTSLIHILINTFYSTNAYVYFLWIMNKHWSFPLQQLWTNVVAVHNYSSGPPCNLRKHCQCLPL